VYIILNGYTRKVMEVGGLFPEKFGEISYGDVVEWSGRSVGRALGVILTVTYSMPHGVDACDGSLVAGQSVTAHDGMVFNVADTSNA
jgi:hypothetical protein